MKLHTTLLLVLLLTQGCLEDIENCAKRNGEITEISYDLDPIRGIEAWDGIDVVLYNSSEQQVLVRAGENIISRIGLQVEEGILTIKDNNQCDWSRRYQAREVHIFLPQVDFIFQNGFGKISSNDTIYASNLRIEARGGTGSIDLLVDAGQLGVYSWRYGTIKIGGKAELLKVQFHNNNAIFDSKDLIAEEISMVHKSNNAFHLRPKNLLKGTIRAKGNVYLYQKPGEIDVDITGSGKIIPRYQEE